MKGYARSSCSKLLFILLLLVIGPVFSAFAQAPPPPDWTLVFGGKVTEFNDAKQKDLPLEGCIITLSGPHSDNQTTASNGKFKVKVPANGDYVLTVTKAGYITKKFEINTFNVPDERAQNPFAEFDVEIDLFKLYPGLDYSVLNNPIARIIYNPAPDVDDFDYDKVYTAQIQAQLDKLKELAREAREKQRLYQAAIDAADKLFNSSDWTNAKVKYQEALGILPNEQYPKDQIAKCEDKLGQNAAEKAKYDALITAADGLFASKDYAGAKAKYGEAQTMRPAEPYPPAQIKKCDDAIAGAASEKAYSDAIAAADAKFNAKDYAGAKPLYQNASSMKPAEQYPKDKMKACDDAIAAAAKEKQYTDAIADADKKFDAKDYTGARAQYVVASGIKPTEQYPKDRIKACDDAMGAAAKDKQYTDAIADADKKFDAKDFTGARAKYVEAQGIKPAETYPPQRIKACDDALATAANDKKYTDAIADADAKFTAKDYANAKAKYQEASGIKPTEQYPKDRMKACDDALAGAAKDKQYNDAIADADKKFDAKDYTNARAQYAVASGIKPTEQYPKDRMKACDDAMGAAAKEKSYQDALTAANAKFDAKDYASAKTLYTNASSIKPDEQYPKDQIKKCDDALTLAEAEKKYSDLIKSADTKFTAKDYAGAKTIYQQASDLKTAEQYPKDQIKKCDDALAGVELDKKYTDLIKQADAKFTAKTYADAKTLYQQASDLKSTEQYPKDRIKACDDAMGAAALDAQYKDLIKQADTKFTAKDYAGAKDLYVQAGNVKPAETYPPTKIKACDDAMAGAETDKKYTDLVKQGDDKFNTKDWNGAKDLYTQAGALKPKEIYPPAQIKKCDDALAADTKNKAYNDLITSADQKFAASDWKGAKDIYQQASTMKPTEQYPKDKMKACDDAINAALKDKQYTDAIADADKKYDAKDFTGARSKYAEASGLKPAEQYPKDRMKLCDDAMGAAAKEKAYTDAIAAADTKFTAKDFAGAKTKYQEASGLKPAEQYPKDRIKACDDALALADAEKKYSDLIKSADTKFTAKDYAGAKTIYQQASDLKTAEQYPKDQIKKCDDGLGAAVLDAQYKDLIKQADTKFTAKDYAGAKDLYVQAGNVKPTETYPPAQIKKCDDAMALAINSKAKADSLAAIDSKYKDLIKQADDKFTAKDWNNAKDLYSQAGAVKPKEVYPPAQIKKCDDALAADTKNKAYNDLITSADAKFNASDWTGAKDIYQQASTMKPTEQYPKDKMKACDDKINGALKDKQYADAIADADKKFDAKDFTGARSQYAAASGIKPTEQYPKDRMKACDDQMGAAAKEKAYTDAIADANKKFDASDWAGAKAKYTEASGLKPTEQYPKDRIKLCDDNLAKETTDKKYKDAITAADGKFDLKDWAGAKAKYTEASGVKPDEQYPKDRIKLCDDNLATAGVQKQYDDLIKQADLKFKASAWSAAKDLYTQASGVKTEEQYPKDQIKACDDKLNSAKDKAYNDLIASADAKFKLSDWTGAKAIYQQASTSRPAEQYPKDQMKACDDNLTAAGIDKQYKTIVDAADVKFNAKDWEGAKAKYNEALGVKPNESYPKDQIKKCDDNIDALLSLDAKYKKAVAKGDSAMTYNDLETAQSAFTTAKELKPSEPYPPKKLAEIAGLLANDQKDKAYRALIKHGDSLMAAKDYDGAKKTFTTATVQRPDDQYPKDKLRELQVLIDDAKTLALQQKNYDTYMAQADKKFAAKDYKGAEALYKKALLEKPMEVLPKTQIQKCEDLLNPKPIVKVDSTKIKATEQYVSDLVAKYQQGITESSSQEGNANTVTRVVIVGNKGWVYKKVVYSWGTYYFKDDVQISENAYNYETNPTYVNSQLAEYNKNHK